MNTGVVSRDDKGTKWKHNGENIFYSGRRGITFKCSKGIEFKRQKSTPCSIHMAKKQRPGHKDSPGWDPTEQPAEH